MKILGNVLLENTVLGNVLNNYVKKTALYSISLAVLGLWLLQVVFSYIGELDSLSDTYTMVDALVYIFYKSPYYLEQFIPTGALLGAVVGLGLLANNSELVVMRASGISNLRIVGWVMQPALLFVLLSLIINQFILPTSNQLADTVGETVDSSLDTVISVQGYWTTQPLHTDINNGDIDVDTDIKEAGKEIIYIEYADIEGNLGLVKRWQLDNEGNLINAFAASSGKYLQANQSIHSDVAVEYQWQLNDSADLFIDTLKSTTSAMQSTVITLPIEPKSVYLVTKDAEDLSISQLYDHRQFMKSQDKRSIAHELAFWIKLFSPFSVFSLVVVACSFVFGSLRTHSLGSRVVASLLFGLFFSYMQDLTGFISLATGISPLFMVLMPICLCAGMGLFLLGRKQ